MLLTGRTKRLVGFEGPQMADMERVETREKRARVFEKSGVFDTVDGNVRCLFAVFLLLLLLLRSLFYFHLPVPSSFSVAKRSSFFSWHRVPI